MGDGSQYSTYHLLTGFIDALCHRIRTPLSVVSNDLAFFETLLGQPEVERSKRRLEEIKSLLQECSQILKVTPGPLSTTEVVAPFSTKVDIPSRTIDKGKEAQLGCVFLRKLLSEVGLDEVASQADILLDGDLLSIIVTLPNPISSNAQGAQGMAALQLLGISSSPIAPLAILLFDSVGAEIRTDKSSNSLILRIPMVIK